jgi:hypothetical protein
MAIPCERFPEITFAAPGAAPPIVVGPDDTSTAAISTPKRVVGDRRGTGHVRADLVALDDVAGGGASVEAGVSLRRPGREGSASARPSATEMRCRTSYDCGTGEAQVYAGAINPSDGIGSFNRILYPWAAAVVPPSSLLYAMFVNNSDAAPMPPLQPLEFVLSISDQLQVFDISHTSSTFHTDDGEPQQNICVGNISGWPGGL